MGSGMVKIAKQSPGMEITAIADLNIERAVTALQEVGYQKQQIKECNNQQKAQKYLEEGNVIVTEDAFLLSKIPALDSLIEATGSTEVGASVAYQSILQGKHIIMLNVETDVTVGWILKRMADQAGVVYTASAGDEPGAVMEIYRFVKTMGFKVVSIGKGKNNPVNFYASPDDVREEALSKNMNPKMLCAFVDGTKTMVEMAEVSNATGALPDIPGMHGAEVEISELASKYIPQKDGGLFANDFVVDYSTGKVSPGVFVNFFTDSAALRNDLKFYSMGEGPYYTIFRPYHLCSFETPISVARACITGEHTVNTINLNSEVVAVAKRDLKAGNLLAGIGSSDFHGVIYSYEESSKLDALPIGISRNARLCNDVKKGDVISYDDVELDGKSFVVQLRKMQDTLVKK